MRRILAGLVCGAALAATMTTPAPVSAQGLAPYQGYLLSTQTALGATDAGWAFATADYNRDGALDLWGIKRSGASGATEVHILDGSKSYQSFLAQTATGLHATDATWDFAVADYNGDGVPDLWAFAKANTGTHSTEVHILDGASGLKTFIAHSGTALHETSDDWSFATGDYNRDGKVDVYALLRHGASNSTEVHVLNGADGWGSFLLHTATPLAPTDGSWAFGATDANGDGAVDVFAIDRTDRASNRTSVHVLDGARAYGAFLSQTATVLGPTDGAWTFVPDDFSRDHAADVLAIHRADQTTVAVLDGAQRPVPPPDPGPGRCGPADAYTLTAALARRTAGFTARPLVTGRLTTPGGAPVGGATVELTTGRTTFGPVGTAVTAADGSWSFSLPQGPSRSVFASVSDGDSTPVCSAVLSQRVRAGARLTVSRKHVRNGARIRFRGRLLGEDAAGRRVDVQGYQPRLKRWLTVATRTAKADGAFTARYRFTSTVRTTTYRFRVLVRTQSGFPYARGTSKTLRVRVRPHR